MDYKKIFIVAVCTFVTVWGLAFALDFVFQPTSQQIIEVVQPVITKPIKVEVRSNRSRGDRNNNPGNIDRNNIQWQGMAADQSGDSRFIIFETPQDGIRAMTRVLRVYQKRHGLNTLNKIIGRWAPSIENNTNAYAKHVAEQVGIGVNTHIDLGNDALMLKVIRAMIRHENGYQPYDEAIIMAGILAEKS